MNAAALILAWRHPEGVSALCNYFARANIDVYIHVDCKVSLDPFYDATREADGKLEFLRDRILIFYGGFSLVEAELKLLSRAVSKGPYDRYLLLSDDSLPLLAAGALRKRLEKHENYVDGGPSEEMRQLRYIGFAMCDSPATQIRPLPYHLRLLDDEAIARLERLLKLKAKGKAPLNAYYKGSTWMGLSHRSVEAVLSGWRDDAWLRESFEFSLFPDESYFHTILGNRGLFISRTLMHDDWSVEMPPRVFRSIPELKAIGSRDALFVRKVALAPSDFQLWLREIEIR